MAYRRSSQTMLSPDGLHLVISGKLAARDFSIRLVEVGFFLWRQLIDGLLFPCELQKDTRKVVLHGRGKAAEALRSRIRAVPCCGVAEAL